MKRFSTYILPLLALGLMVLSCGKDSADPADVIPQEVINKISAMGFNPDGIEKVDEGYRIERDIIITPENLADVHAEHRVPEAEQYRTFNVVNTGGGRNITVYIPQGGNSGFSSTYVSALDEAINRYNAENLDLTFSRVTSSSGANIVFSRLSKRDERQGVLGSAGFPSSNGNPYGQIKMSGILQSTYGLSVNGIATIMAHEMGHCIGFRHTDYFDRSISCGGGASNEGSGSVGAVHIPGTPTGATLSAKSWMLSCTDGGNRPFNNDDRTALSWMYINNF